MLLTHLNLLDANRLNLRTFQRCVNNPMALLSAHSHKRKIVEKKKVNSVDLLGQNCVLTRGFFFSHEKKFF